MSHHGGNHQGTTSGSSAAPYYLSNSTPHTTSATNKEQLRSLKDPRCRRSEVLSQECRQPSSSSPYHPFIINYSPEIKNVEITYGVRKQTTAPAGACCLISAVMPDVCARRHVLRRARRHVCCRVWRRVRGHVCRHVCAWVSA